MTPADLIDQFFPEEGEEGKKEPDEDLYPGSRRPLPKAKFVPVREFISDPWKDNYTIKTIGGVETKMYAIGALATALGVSVPSIRYWTRAGYLPLAPYRLPSNMIVSGKKVSGRRLYTEPLIEAVIDAFAKRDLLGKPRIEWSQHKDLPIEIREAWSRIINTTN